MQTSTPWFFVTIWRLTSTTYRLAVLQSAECIRCSPHRCDKIPDRNPEGRKGCPGSQFKGSVTVKRVQKEAGNILIIRGRGSAGHVVSLARKQGVNRSGARL